MDTPALLPALPGTATEQSASEQRSTLERERLRIQAEIVSYPMPILACDVYFNHLLEQRARICEQLAVLERRDAVV